MTKPVPSPFVSVYRDGTLWRWTCRVPSCEASSWRGRHTDAIADAHGHLAKHSRFGFKR